MRTCSARFIQLMRTLTVSALCLLFLHQAEAGYFTNTGSLTTARYRHSATLLPDGTVLIAGGSVTGSWFASLEIYDPNNGVCTNAGAPNDIGSGHTATLLPNGTVWFTGGYVGSGARSIIQLYDPAT